MISIAHKNLIHDRTRLAMALGGILFAVVLMVFAVGMMYGTLNYAVDIVDHSDADIWVLSSKTDNMMSPSLFDDGFATQLRSIAGVQSSSNLVMASYQANLRDGEAKSVYLIGFDPATGLGQPWTMTGGQVSDLRRGMTAVIDKSAISKFGPLELGQELEVSGQDIEIVGFCEGATWMLGMPYLYTSVKSMQRLMHWDGKTMAVLVKAAPGANIGDIRRRIAANPDLRVLSRQEIHDQEVEAWLAGTPAGYMSGAMVGIGFIVGLMMVGITLYTATIERIRGFGVLKAIGASNSDVYQIILAQALILAVVGYGLGMAGGLVVGRLYESAAGMAFVVPPLALLAVLAMVLFMSAAAAFFAIRRVAKIDPALVFRG